MPKEGRYIVKNIEKKTKIKYNQMKTKRIYLYLLLLVMSTATVWADKYYKPAGAHTAPIRHSELVPGMKFFIYNTSYKSYLTLNERLDYTPKNVARNLNRTRSDRYIRSVSITGSTASGEKSYTTTAAEQAKVYTAKTGKVFVVNAGETLTPHISHDGSWINAAVFIDYNADGFTLVKSEATVHASTTLPTEGKPEYIYHIKNANSRYATSTAVIASSAVQYGQFALYAAKEVGAFYIYSLGEQKWLGYTKADSYNNGHNFVTLHDSKNDAQPFFFNNYTGNRYDIAPYKNDGSVDTHYLNWYQGTGDRAIGLWQEGGASDNGSSWLFEYIDYTDVVSYSFYTFNENSDVKGFNSAGAVISGGGRSTSLLPSFKAPMAPGRYRMRFLLDYNNINADGTGERSSGGGSTMGNGGSMVDVILEVTGSNDYTGFAYNNTTSLGLSKEKANNMNIFNECYIFTLEDAGEENAYYIKSLSTGSYLDIYGSTANIQPQKLYIYSWPQAVTLDTDEYVSGGNGAVANNGNIKQALDVNSEAANYTIIQNSQLIDQTSWETKQWNPYNVFVITDGNGNYWNGEPKAFAVGETGHPYAFIDATDVDKNDYADIVDLHIYSRCDLYSAQAIYGYVQKATNITQSHPATMDGETPCDLSRLIDGDFTTYSMTDASKNTAGDYHYLTFDLGEEVPNFYLYMARRADAQYAPTIIEVSVSNSPDGEFVPVPDSDNLHNDITNGQFSTGLDTKLEYFSQYAIELGGSYRYVRIKAIDCTSAEMCMALSELYILPNKPVIQQALTYKHLPLYETRADYTAGIDALNLTNPEVKILSGVPIPGNKYRMYADAYDAESDMFVNYDIYIKATEAGGVITYTLANDGDYDAATADERKYYEWVCEQLPNGEFMFRNPKTGKFLADGVLVDETYTWTYNTNQTYRHGVPLIDADGRYLAVGTAVSDGARSWMTDVWSAQNQTTYYTYLNNGHTPDDTTDDVWEVDNNVRACTDFVFLPLENTENEKKVNVYADPLAIRNSIFRYNGTQYNLPFAHLLIKPEVDIEYDLLCTIKNANGLYATPTTGHTTIVENAGIFAFCKHESVENGYYIYSVSEKKWLTYDVAESYSSGPNKISLSNTKNEAAFFIIADQTRGTTSGKDISPVTTAGEKAGIYFNWFGGGGDTMGFYTTNGAGDAGSLMILTPQELQIEELCGSLHKFQGFYKMNEDEPVTTEKELTFADVEDGAYYEARFYFDKPFEESTDAVEDADGNIVTPATVKFYKIKNLATGKYATYRAKNKTMQLTDEATASSLFCFTEMEYDGESHVRAYIESAISGNKLYSAGVVDNDGEKTGAEWNPGGQKYYVQPNYVSSAAEGQREGFAISSVMLNENNNPEGLCSNATSGLVGAAGVSNAGALWVFEPADDAKALLEAYIDAMATEINGYLDVQHSDYDEEANPGVPDTTYPVYDERKIQYHRDYIAQIKELAASTNDLAALSKYAEEIYATYFNIQSTTLALPEQTIKWNGDLTKYAPKWYYIRNVKDSHEKQADRAAKYVGDKAKMAITTLDEGKSLANLFYVGGGVHQEGTVDEHLDNCCIHNFSAHYHHEANNEVVDKTLVSENETLFENISIIGNNEILNNIAGVQTLPNEKSWHLVLEGKSNGNSYNAWGSAILAGLSNPIADDYTNSFQIYMKADGYILVKTSGYDGKAFDHIRGAYETFKIELLWTPNVHGSTAEKVAGKFDIFVTNSVGVTQNHTLNLQMKDITVFSSAMPKGMDITTIKAEEVKMMTWNELHTDSNWFILPTTNTTYPGHSIVIGSAATDNLGWCEDGANADVITSVGSADYASWEFVKVVDFKEHMQELLNLWNIDECLVYNKDLVALYKEIKSIYNRSDAIGVYTEDDFNSMVVAIRRYHGLTISEFYKPKAGKLYTVRPAYEAAVNNAAVNEYNSLVRSNVTNSAGEINSRGVWMFEGNDSTQMRMKSLHTQSYIVATASDSIVLGSGDGTVCLTPLGATEVSISSNNDGTYLKRHSVGDIYVTSDYNAPDKDYYNRYIDVTFTRTGTEVASVTSAIVGEFAKKLGDATAEFVSIDGAALKASQNALTDNIVCPDVNGNAGANVELVFYLNNLPEGFAFNNVGLDIHAFNNSGIYQYNNDDCKRLWNVAVSVAESVDALATAPVLAELNDIDIAAGVGESGNVHKMWNISTDDLYEVNGSCYVKVAITSGSANEGCFFGLSQIILSQEGDTWYIEEIPEPQTTVYYPASTTINGHATLMLGYDAVIPDGVEAFYSTGLSGLPYYLLMTSYNGILPKNAPVVLRNTDRTAEAKDFKFYYSAAEGAADNDCGFMAGSLFFTPVQCLDNHNYYMIMKNQDVAKMYWVYEEYDENGEIVAPNTDNGGWVVCHANKAYMVLDKTTAQNVVSYAFGFNMNGTTDIDEVVIRENVTDVEIVETIYDLQGRRLTEITEPGIYIVNGKKVVVE